MWSIRRWRGSQFVSIAEPTAYKALKLTLSSTSQGSLLLYEVQFMVCNQISADLSYPQSSYTFYAKHDVVSISSGVFGITSCQSNPPLPDGISVDSQCNIMGTATAATSATTYTITGSAGSNTVTGTITLTFTECQELCFVFFVPTSRFLVMKPSVFATPLRMSC